MTRKKTNKSLNVLNIFFRNIKVYFLYLDQTTKYLFVPIFGQIAGLALIFIAAYYYNINIDNLTKIPFFAGNEHILLGLLIVISPFLALFLHSYYRYIIAYSALNVVFYTVSSKKTAKEIDFKANDRVIERKLFQYILMMLFISIICLVPPLWVLVCLSFQVFALESDTNCFKAISRSIKFTSENLVSVIIMLVLVFITTYWFLPELFNWAMGKIKVVEFIASKIEVYLQFLPYSNWNAILSMFDMKVDSFMVSKCLTECVLSFIITGFTLPFRCACFTDLYRNFDNEQIKELSREDEEIIKRASPKKRKKS